MNTRFQFILILILFCCCKEKKTFTTKEIDLELRRITSDSTAAFTQLAEELRVRTFDTAKLVNDSQVVNDSETR